MLNLHLSNRIKYSALFILLLGVFSFQVQAKVHEVKKGQSIQAAVKKASKGDTIKVYPGVYKETVYIDKDDITLSGVIIKGEWPILDGEKKLNDAILYSGHGVTIEHMQIINYKGNAIMGQAGNNYIIRHNLIKDAGVYGIFPQFGKNGVVEYNVVSGIEDAAIYIGMCDNVDVRFNEVFDSVAGIEIENTRHALVEGNYVYNNTGGILAFITPGLPIKTTYDVIIRSNFVVNNNHPNFGEPGSLVASIPPGTGMLIMAADDVVIEDNIISGNDNSGIAIVDLRFSAGLGVDPGTDPNPDGIKILNNFMHNNGNKPVGDIKKLMMATFSNKGPDIGSISRGKDNCIVNEEKYRTFGLGIGGFTACKENFSTKHIATMTLKNPVQAKDIEITDKGKLAYYGICAGCHSYSMRMIGPSTMSIQAMYMDNAKGLAEYIANPVRKREDFPEMPPQNYLPEDVRMAVAEYVLTMTDSTKLDNISDVVDQKEAPKRR
jgi:parallel beta-helix repeat protein